MRRRTVLTAATALPLLGGAAPDIPAGVPAQSYEIWDVFTNIRMLGNPLAVFPDARQLPEAQLSAIAREMAHSETTFVYPGDSSMDMQQGIRTRIFSRAGIEMPFAGHPVLGTAFHLNVSRRLPEIPLLLPAGKVPVSFRQLADRSWEGEMIQPEPVFAEIHKAEALAPLLGRKANDFDAALPLQNVSTGRPNILVLLKTVDAVRRASVDWRALNAYLATGDRERGIYLLARTADGFHARKPTPLGDDPVTGSAAGCAIAALVTYQLVAAAKRITIQQGSEVHRPGELFASAELREGKATQVKIGGQAICSARGVLL